MDIGRRFIIDMWRALRQARAQAESSEIAPRASWYLPLPVTVRVDFSLLVGSGRRAGATTFSWAAFDQIEGTAKALTVTLHPN